MMLGYKPRTLNAAYRIEMTKEKKKMEMNASE